MTETPHKTPRHISDSEFLKKWKAFEVPDTFENNWRALMAESKRRPDWLEWALLFIVIALAVVAVGVGVGAAMKLKELL